MSLLPKVGSPRTKHLLTPLQFILINEVLPICYRGEEGGGGGGKMMSMIALLVSPQHIILHKSQVGHVVMS